MLCLCYKAPLLEDHYWQPALGCVLFLELLIPWSLKGHLKVAKSSSPAVNGMCTAQTGCPGPELALP